MPYSEFKAMLDSLAMLLFDWRTGILMLLLAAAAVSDYRVHRIPNWLVFSGALFGVIYDTALAPSPHINFFFSLTGIGLGLMLFLPLYLVRAMGAGDVKLLAMVGAFLGPRDTFFAALASMIVGGGLSILFVVVQGTTQRMFHNLGSLCQLGLLSVAGVSKPDVRIGVRVSAGKLPYGVAIAIGTMGYLITDQLGFL